jgi:crotonobetainyl-CoA:carnitine CoA-transferase CaiB-like acyl-CoA transferase
MPAPLAGVRVIEFGAVPAIAYAGKLFADLGAEVTRVEMMAGEGAACDDGAADATSGLGLYLHAGKGSALTIDPRMAGSVELAELCGRSSVLLHGQTSRARPSAFSPDAMAKKYPGLVVVAVTPFGLQGEVREWAADDLTLQALGGISIGIGLPGRAPLKLPGEQSAFQGGLAAAIAALGTLFSGRGALIDVAVADVWASFYSGPEVALAHFHRHGKRRAGHRVRGQPYPRTIFRCKDGYFAVQCGENRHWQGFLRMIGREDLVTHALFANRFSANDQHGDECDALIEPWFLARAKDEILALCLEHRIPGAPVYDVREVLDHPHLHERHFFAVTNTHQAQLKLPGTPYGDFGRMPAKGGATSKIHACPAPDPRPQKPRPTGDAAGTDTRRPLAGVRVLDFGWVWAGAVPGHILADMGAEVIKIESANPLDYMRQGRPIVGTKKDPEQNPMFQNVNRGKLSLRIKLDHPDANGVLKELVASSDVVIENFSPGVMKKFGLAYPQLRLVRPDIVMCSMSAAGQHGPLCGIRTYATMIASLAGLDSLVGFPDGRVLGSQSSFADPNASLHATFGILAALWRRYGTGQGAYIDLSQWEAAVNVLGEQIADYSLHKQVRRPSGTLHDSKVPHGNYPCRGDDRWIAISVNTDAQWQALGASLDTPEWMSEKRFASAAGRRANRAELDERLAQSTSRHEADALAAALTVAGVAAAALLDASGVANSSLFRQRQLFEMVEHPVLGSVPVYRLPWHIDESPVSITRRAPLLGEHNDYALREILGYSNERISAMRDAGLFC